MFVICTKLKRNSILETEGGTSEFVQSLQTHLSRLIAYAESADTMLQREVSKFIRMAIACKISDACFIDHVYRLRKN